MHSFKEPKFLIICYFSLFAFFIFALLLTSFALHLLFFAPTLVLELWPTDQMLMGTRWSAQYRF